MKNFLALLSLAIVCTAMSAQPTQWSSRGPGGGGALFLPSFNPNQSGDLAVACDMSQAFRTTNYGAQWNQIDFHQLQTFNAFGKLLYTKDVNLMFAYDATSIDGADTHRPSKSTDGGKTWTVTAADPAGAEGLYLYASFEKPGFLVLANYSNVYTSNNGGTTWNLIYTTSNGAGTHVAGVFFAEPDIWIGLNTGLLYSSDGGATFTYRNELPGLDTTAQAIFSFTGGQTVGLTTTTSLYAVVSAAGDVYAGVTSLDNPGFDGIYVMNWDEKKWVKRVNGINSGDYPYLISMSPKNQMTCYAAGGSESGVPTINKTTDGGATWVQTFNVANNKNIITGWSGDGGDRAWTYGELALGFTVNPSNINEAAITDFGFVHLTTDGGVNWRQMYVGSSTQNPAGSPTPKGKSYASVGLENTTCWHIVWLDSMNLYGCYSDIQGTRSTDGGRTWGFNYTGQTDNTLYHVVKHPQTGTVYGATGTVHDLYQSTRLADAQLDNGAGKILFSTDNGAAWQTLHDFAHCVVWLALDPANSKRMYASVVHSSQGGIYVSDNIDAGSASTWTRLPAPPRTEGRPFNIKLLNDGKLLTTYSARRDDAGKFTASSGVFLYNGSTWSDLSDGGMQYWTKDIIVDPADADQNTWYVAVFSGWGGPATGKGGLYRTTNRGQSWTRINDHDRVTSLTFNPKNAKQAYMTTETDGLWYFADISASSPIATLVASYNFRQPERVFFNPYNQDDIWVASYGNGIKTSATTTVSVQEPFSNHTSIFVSPNPASDFLRVSCGEVPAGNIEVVDVLGRTVISVEAESGETVIPCSDLKPGFYQVLLGRESMRFCVIH